MNVSTAISGGQVKRISEILISSIPSGMREEQALSLEDGALRAHLANFWSGLARKDGIYTVTPIYSFAELVRQYDGIAQNAVCKKSIVLPKLCGVKPVRLKVITNEELGEHLESVPFSELHKEIRKLDIEVATPAEMLGFLAQECITPSDVLNERSVIALGGSVKDAVYKDGAYMTATRKRINVLTDKIHCSMFGGDTDDLHTWGLNLLVHA